MNQHFNDKIFLAEFAQTDRVPKIFIVLIELSGYTMQGCTQSGTPETALFISLTGPIHPGVSNKWIVVFKRGRTSLIIVMLLSGYMAIKHNDQHET